MSAPSIPLLILEDDVIRRMLKTPEIVAAFPFLSGAAKKEEPPARRRCGRCPTKQRRNVSDYNGLKQAIQDLPLAKKAELRRMLGAAQVRFYFRDRNNRRNKVTF